MMPPAPIGTNAPDLDVNSAFAYVVFTVATVFIILYSVYLALIREDEEEEDVEGGGGDSLSRRRRGGANIDEDDEDDDEYGDRGDESTSTVTARSSAVFSKLSNELKETISREKHSNAISCSPPKRKGGRINDGRVWSSR